MPRSSASRSRIAPGVTAGVAWGFAAALSGIVTGCGSHQAASPAASPAATQPLRAAGQPPPGAPPTGSCVASGDGYLRAHLAGAIDADIDWPDNGTHCEGESRVEPAGVRLSFRRETPNKPDLLFVFGVTGVLPGQPAHAAGANLTVIVQGTDRIYGTLGDSRCTVDSLTQRSLPQPQAFRVEARGFCTSPAHAVRGDGDVLMSTFEFAGVVNYAAAAGMESPAPATTARTMTP